MEVSILIPIIILAAYLIVRSARRQSAPKEGDHPYFLHEKALQARWAAINREIAEHGKPVSVPAWWADQATERQISRLEREQIYIQTELTKGQCSDIISLLEPPGQAELDILRFFGVPKQGATEFEVNEQVRQIFTDPANREKWKNNS